MNITGNWSYKEDFEYGTSEGEVQLTQEGYEVNGIFTFSEKVVNDYEIDVIEKVKGIIDNGMVLLQSTEVKATQDEKEIPYLSNTFEVHLVSDNKLVGSTYDQEEVCGVFVLERLLDTEY